MFIFAAKSGAKTVQTQSVSHERCRVQSTMSEGWRAEALSSECRQIDDRTGETFLVLRCQKQREFPNFAEEEEKCFPR
jgi:hypothetical protein